MRSIDEAEAAAEEAHARAAEARRRLHPMDPARPDDPDCAICGEAHGIDDDCEPFEAWPTAGPCTQRGAA